MGDLEYEPLTLTAAKELTERIRLAATEYGDLIVTAFNRRADVVMGYDTWEEYVKTEFPSIPRFDSTGDRPALARTLTQDVGMTTRQAGATLGVAHTTIERDLSGTNVPEPTRAGSDDDMEDRAVRMAAAGMSLARIAETLGIDRRSALLRSNERVRNARRDAEPDSMPTVTHEENTIACEIRPAKDVIAEIDYSISNLLSLNLYTLGRRDINKLRSVLSDRLKELEVYNGS